MQNLGCFLRSASSSVCPHLVAISSQFFFSARQDSGSLLGLYFPVLWFRKFLWEEAEGTVGAPEGFSAVRAWSLAVGVLCLPAVGLYTLSGSLVKAGGGVWGQPVWSLVAGQW